MDSVTRGLMNMAKVPQCKPANRPVVRFDDETLIDKEIYWASVRYARKHGVSLEALIECALVTYLHNEHEPVQIRFCEEHRVAMEVNSSGTVTNVCPVSEGLGGGFNPEEVR